MKTKEVEVKIWCSECIKFHKAKQNKDYPNIFEDKHGNIIAVWTNV